MVDRDQGQGLGKAIEQFPGIRGQGSEKRRFISSQGSEVRGQKRPIWQFPGIRGHEKLLQTNCSKGIADPCPATPVNCSEMADSRSLTAGSCSNEKAGKWQNDVCSRSGWPLWGEKPADPGLTVWGNTV